MGSSQPLKATASWQLYGLGPVTWNLQFNLGLYSENEEGWCQLQEFSPFRKERKGPLPPALVFFWARAVRKQYPLPALTNSFQKMFFGFSPPAPPAPPSAIISFPFLTYSHPNFLPLYKTKVMNEAQKIKTECSTPPVCLLVYSFCTEFGTLHKDFVYVFTVRCCLLSLSCAEFFGADASHTVFSWQLISPVHLKWQ